MLLLSFNKLPIGNNKQSNNSNYLSEMLLYLEQIDMHLSIYTGVSKGVCRINQL